ncbi:MAG: hypothetical protein ACRDID_13885, partial [Ktedonobacterales bacterium]
STSCISVSLARIAAQFNDNALRIAPCSPLMPTEGLGIVYSTSVRACQFIALLDYQRFLHIPQHLVAVNLV